MNKALYAAFRKNFYVTVYWQSPSRIGHRKIGYQLS